MKVKILCTRNLFSIERQTTGEVNNISFNYVAYCNDSQNKIGFDYYYFDVVKAVGD